jgi:hypothetical protein
MRKPACDTCHIAGLLPFFHPFEDLPVPYVVVFDDGNSHFFNLIGHVSTKQLITVVDRTAVVVAEVDRMAVAEADRMIAEAGRKAEEVGRKAAEVDRKAAEVDHKVAVVRTVEIVVQRVLVAGMRDTLLSAGY